MSADWYQYSAQQGPGAGYEGSLVQRAARIQGDINADSGTLQVLTVKGTLTLDVGGSIVDGNGSSWTKAGVFIKTTTTDGQAFSWTSTIAGATGTGYLAHDGGTLAGNTAGVYFGLNTGYALRLSTQTARLSIQGTAYNTFGTGFELDGAAGTFTLRANVFPTLLLDANNDAKFYRRIYPGLNTGGAQAARYIEDDGTFTKFSGPAYFGSASATRFATAAAGGSGALPVPGGYLVISDAAGSLRLIPTFSSAGPWTT